MTQPHSDNEDRSPVISGEDHLEWARLQVDQVVHYVPRSQPTSVRKITEQLFEPYHVEEGHVHLAGCTLEDRPILRLTFEVPRRENDGQRGCLHVFIGPDGVPFSPDVAHALGLDGSRIVPLAGKTPRISRDRLDKLMAAGQEAAKAEDIAQRAERCEAALIWCKFAEGKLCFAIGQHSAEVAFADWAQLFAAGRSKPPPMAGPDGRRQSYHVAATDDGRVTIAEAIAQCDVSGRRVLDTELETCQATGRRVLPRYLQTCPISGRRLLAETFVTCNLCRQQIDPTAVTSGRCRACRSLQPVSKDEPRMARVLCVFPALDRWRRWKMAETDTAYVLRGAGVLRCLLVVLEKDSLQPIRVAWRGPLLSRWSDVPQVQAHQLMKRKDGPA